MNDCMVKALKSDLEAAEKRLIEDRREFEKILERMMRKTTDIESYRNSLYKLGVNTKRSQPWGKIEYVP